ILGLTGKRPDNLCPDEAERLVAQVRSEGRIGLNGHHAVRFDEQTDIVYRRKDRLPFHSNGMRLALFGPREELVRSRIFYSIGGGAVVTEADVAANAP